MIINFFLLFIFIMQCLDYTTIYNKSYRTELYMNFFNVRGSYEWIRWILSFIIAVAIGFIAWAAKAIIKVIVEFKFEAVGGQMERGEVWYYVLAYVIFASSNVALTVAGSLIAVYFEPTAAGSGIPEVKAYLNGTKVHNRRREEVQKSRVVWDYDWTNLRFSCSFLSKSGTPLSTDAHPMGEVCIDGASKRSRPPNRRRRSYDTHGRAHWKRCEPSAKQRAPIPNSIHETLPKRPRQTRLHHEWGWCWRCCCVWCASWWDPFFSGGGMHPRHFIIPL